MDPGFVGQTPGVTLGDQICLLELVAQITHGAHDSASSAGREPPAPPTCVVRLGSGWARC
jgi:hypothetical protein